MIILFIFVFSISIGDAGTNYLRDKSRDREYKYISNLKKKIKRTFRRKELYTNKDSVKYADSLMNIVSIYEGTHTYYIYNIEDIVIRGHILKYN